MAAWSRILRPCAQRQRSALRALVVNAAIALVIDGLCVERSVLHLLLLHPLVLLALIGALVLTEEPDPPGAPHER